MTKRPPLPCRPASALIDDDIVAAMRRLVGSRTDECLNSRFGISYNSWRKILAGKPVRASLAARVEAKVRLLLSSEAAEPPRAR